MVIDGFCDQTIENPENKNLEPINPLQPEVSNDKSTT